MVACSSDPGFRSAPVAWLPQVSPRNGGALHTTKRAPLSRRACLAAAARLALAAGLALALLAAPRAAAETVALPLSGLAPDLPEGGWQVAARWRPSADPEVGGSGEDVLSRVVDGAVVARYAIAAGGRTDRPCPLERPLVLELDGVTWIHDAGARTLCRLEDDARLELAIEAGDPAPEAHAAVLAALAAALAARATDPDAPPPLRDPRVVMDAASPAPDGATLGALALGRVGLTALRPDDGYLWRVARPQAGRDFDALVRVFPTFPEVQLLVYRHATRDLPDCGALVRRQVARGPWRGAAGGHMTRTLGRFAIVERCVATANGLLDVRVAAAPRPTIAREVAAAGPMLAALDEAARRDPLPPLPPTIPARDVLYRWAAGALGLAFADAGPLRAVGEVDLGVTYWRRNGVFARAAARLGGTSIGLVASGVADLGVALGLDPTLTLVLSLGLRDEVDPIMENRSLSLSLELYSGFHRDRALPWALRVVAFQLASRQPAITGAPLLVAWDAVLPGGLVVGLDLRWVERPLAPLPGWPGAGLVLGVRLGLGDLRR